VQKRRVNIQVLGGAELSTAVERVASAMAQGRISGEGKYYCWASTFTDGIIVVTRGPGKRFVNSDSFIVYEEKR